jgi:hypothetical protein
VLRKLWNRKKERGDSNSEGQEEVVMLKRFTGMARFTKEYLCRYVCEKESVQTVGEDGDLSIYTTLQ